MPASDTGTAYDPSTLRADWPAHTVDPQWMELLPVLNEHCIQFVVSQAKPGAMIEIDAVTQRPEEPDALDMWKVQSMLRLSEIDAAHLGVILTLFADAEDCIAIREEILKGPLGAKILARSIRRQAEKNAARAPAPAPAEPGEPVSSSATFTAGATRLTTVVGPNGAIGAPKGSR